MNKKTIMIAGADVAGPVKITKFPIDSGMCLDCDWDGLLKDADTDSEWDPFKMMDVPYPICPECGGGIDDYYSSKLIQDEDKGNVIG